MEGRVVSYKGLEVMVSRTNTLIEVAGLSFFLSSFGSFVSFDFEPEALASFVPPFFGPIVRGSEDLVGVCVGKRD